MPIFKGDALSGTGFMLVVVPTDSVGWFVQISTTERSVGGTPGAENTIEDSIFVEETGATVYDEAIIIVIGIPNPPPPEMGQPDPLDFPVIVYESKDINIATVDQGGKCTWVSDGNVRISVKGPGLNRPADITVKENVGVTSSVFNRFDPGSASEDAWNALSVPIDPLGGTPTSENQNIFETMDTITPLFVRNSDPTFWGKNLDLTPLISNKTPAGTNWYQNGCLVTRNCFLTVAHAKWSVGASAWFVANDDTMHFGIVDRVIDLRNGAYSNGVLFDLAVHILDRDIDAKITVAKILPSDWQLYLPSVPYDPGILNPPANQGNGLPQIRCTKFRKAEYINSIYAYNQVATDPDFTFENMPRLEDLRASHSPFFVVTESGDSGTPRLTFFNGEPIYIGILEGYTFWGGNSNTDVVNAVLTDETPGRSLIPIDLSGFNTYP